MRMVVAVCVVLLSACVPGETVVPPSNRGSGLPSPIAAPSAVVTPASTLCPESAGPSDVPVAGRQLGLLQFVDKSNGWVVSGVGPDLRVLRTADGGASWAAGSVVPASYAIDVRFADHCVGWLLAVSDGGALVVLYGTTDSGRTWHEQIARPNRGRLSGATSGLGPLTVVDADHVFVVADLAGCPAPCLSELLETNDRGVTWQSIHSFGAVASALRFADRLAGWAITYDPASTTSAVFQATTDGGRSWSARVLPPFADQLEFVDSSHGWALGRDGGWCTSSACSRWYLYRTTDAGARWIRLHESEDPSRPAWWLPNPSASSASFLHGPHFTDISHGWIALDPGAGGAGLRVGGVVTTADGGVTWQQSGIEPYPKNLKGVSFVDAETGWATSGSLIKRGSDQLFGTHDGGQTWEPVLPSLESELSRVRTAVSFRPWIPVDAPRPGLTAAVRLPTEAKVGNPSLVIEYRTSPIEPVMVHVLEGPAGCCLDLTRAGQPLDVIITPALRGQLIPNQAQFGGPILWWDASVGTGPATYVAVMSSVLTTDELIAFARSFVPLP